MASDQELYEGLSWKIENEDWTRQRQASKIRDLAAWYDKHKFFTPPQQAFVKELLGPGKLKGA